MTADGVFIELGGARFTPTPEGALWWPQKEALIVSDLHFEKGSSFAARGVFLPPYDTRTTLKRLGRVVATFKPKRVISLGDAFHDGGAEARIDERDAETLERLVASVRWTWVLGNHDPAPPKRFAGEAVAAERIGRLTFRHEPAAGPAEGEIAGHLHPCARVRTESRVQRRRCFATDGARLVMPAFGAYAGGLNLLDEAFACILQKPVAWVMGRARVYPIAPALLVADPPAAARLAI
ncbi:MAG: ligase-associated DNA damage response endonuclease PdeM [Alphaproteobacteria bacterium]|nr:ligase-associated DNA damage response endonuclease PdeM [Alphaproteobacteria bacterium]